MISTDFNFEEYERLRIERHKAEGLRFVPEGTGPKVYCVVCENASDWNEIHNYIINENEIDNIPNRKIECTNLKKTCDRIGSYEISDAEAEQLKNHPKIIAVNIDEQYYEGTYKGKKTYPRSQPSSKTARYGQNVKISLDTSGSGFNGGSDATWLSKTAGQIYRHQTLTNPWKNLNDNTIITDNPEQYGDGTDVDVVVNDSASWFGHVEFVKTGVGEPTNFVGTNVLKSGFAASATTGVCGVLDVILHAPYYIDPDFFEADPSSRLRKRWDGTTVPVESVARAWWNNESTAHRSAKYVGANLPGGTATIGSNEDFGTISVSSNYTEAIHNGSDTVVSRRCELHTGAGFATNPGSHGTPCMSQSYGKTHGWAYNANKWFISVFWASGSMSSTTLLEVLKVFHNLKPNRSSDNTKNPTITSNSWGIMNFFAIYGNSAHFRTPGDGTAGSGSIDTIGAGTGGNGISPEWLNHFWAPGFEHEMWYPPTNNTMVEGAAMLDAGVIWMGAAGNNNQKQVLGDHPDYNNYTSDMNKPGGGNGTLAEAEFSSTLVNRIGFPNCIGILRNYNGGGIDVYRTFNIGALDDETVSNGDGTYQERKIAYSNMGNAIDCYTIGDDSIGAQGGGSYFFPRNDSTYRIDSNYAIVTSGGTLSLTSYDQRFGGTSSATPVSTGLFATKLQHNRNWTWSDLKNWLATRVTDQSNDAEFLQGTESTTASDSNWNSQINLQGGARKILWDAPTSDPNKISINGSGLNLSGPFTIS